MRITENLPRNVGRVASIAGALWLGSYAEASSDAPLPRVILRAPPEMVVGELSRLEIEVQLPEVAAEPLMLTPYRDGEALEVVKGRLLRSDARDPAGQPLRFELPVLARAHGSARVGVRLLAYLCEPGCRAVEVEDHKTVVVLPRYGAAPER